MTTQTLKIGKREFVLIPKHEFDRLTAQARQNAEDTYWTESALKGRGKGPRQR
jgi:hypothetical protein